MCAPRVNFTAQIQQMAVHTTEIASAILPSDNPIHQRLLFAYVKAAELVSGDLLDVGCGEGRGTDLLMQKCRSYTAVDKIEEVIERLKKKYPSAQFIAGHIPPFPFEDNRFDSVVSFQVIEHIEDDQLFMREIHRVLKPGGIAVLTTPNIKMTLTRNPWHVREYTREELTALSRAYFSDVGLLGVYGDEKVNQYYEENKKSVRKFTRFDIFNLQYRLPRTWLQVPYDILNRINRNRLKTQNEKLVMEINTSSFRLQPADDRCYDFFLVLKK
ncbi:MAG: hypothetical protein KatS3mg031_1184 [Chitinophagales bacterium]|nr:MAG: hypothetical protein KatS3mg031_1184 [Chitinophagales bacterium]